MAVVNTVESFAFKATNWIGSVQSLIVHTIIFVGSFGFLLLGVSFDKILLVLTTLLSFEAIYLSIFIQMSVNRHEQALQSVGEDVDDIQESMDDLHETVTEISEDIDEIQEDIDEIQEDIDDIQEDIDEIQEDVEEMAEPKAVKPPKQPEHLLG